MDIPQRLTPTQKTPGAGRWVTVDVYDNEIYIGQKEGPPTGYPQPIVVFSSSGKLLRSFGADGIALVTEGSAEAYPNPYWGLEKIRVQPPDSATGRPPRLWVMDYENHSIALFSLNGTLLEIMGTPGVPASQTEPDLKKFGYVSHVAFREGMAYVADGERAAGMVNRLTSFDASLSGTPAGPLLVNPSLPPAKRIMETFLTPHSIIYDQPTDLLLVGDRGSLPSGNPSNYRLSPQTGHAAIKLVDWRTLGVVGELRCDALNLTVHMPPIALLRIPVSDAELLAMVVGGYNQSDGGWSENQGLKIIDVTGFGDTSSCVSVVQSIPFSDDFCHVPHDMALDSNGNIYVTCLGYKGAHVRRFKLPAKHRMRR